MNQIEIADIGRISRELDAFYTALKSFIYYTELNEQYEVAKDNKEFWNFIEFTLLYTLLLNWNEVFGITKENNHWKELTQEDPDYLKRLYEAGGFNYTSWVEYRKYINDLKHEFVLFPDPYHHRIQEINLDGIKVSLEVTHQWFVELTTGSEALVNSEELSKWPISSQGHQDKLKQEALAVLSVSSTHS